MANDPVINLDHIKHHIEALESRNAFQDDVIDKLNEELTIHQAEIAELKMQVKLVVERMKDSASSGVGKMEQEPPPPHY